MGISHAHAHVLRVVSQFALVVPMAIASKLARLVERMLWTGSGPGFEPQTGMNFSITEEVSFLLNPCGFACGGFVLATSGWRLILPFH